MATVPNTLILWVKPEPFSYGTLSVSPHPRLSLNNIKKIIPYTKSKELTHFPLIRYSVWKHIACSKLQLSEDLAWMYFSLCHLLSEDLRPEDHSQYDHFLSYNSNSPEKESIGGSLSVNIFKFVLFLYIQQLHKVSLRTSLVTGVTEWPSNTADRSPDLESRSSNAKSLDEHCHTQFVQNHLQDILALLVQPDSYVGSDSGITVSALQALDFIIGASTDSHRQCTPFHRLALMQNFQTKSGYSKLTETFSLRTLHNWITSHLTNNPFGISSCIVSGRRLSWPLTVTVSDGDTQMTTMRGKVASNVHIVPKDIIKGNKIIIMSQMSRQTVARNCPTLENSSVKIHRCHYSFIYLLSPLRSVTIEKCRNTMVILGAIETNIVLSHCEQVTVIAATRYITLSSCTLCMLYVLTPNYPLLLGANDTILLAPYHTWYPKLEEHMSQVGLGAMAQMWHQPLCVGPDHQAETPVWQHLPVSEFFIFTIPFTMDGPTTSIPGGLPPAYQHTINERQKEIDDWQTLVKEACLSRPQRKELQSLVESRFHIWLSETGLKAQLDSLVVPMSCQLTATSTMLHTCDESASH